MFGKIYRAAIFVAMIACGTIGVSIIVLIIINAIAQKP